MKEETRYNYERRIKELQSQVDNLSLYRSVAVDIQSTIFDLMDKRETISMVWILRQFRRVQK